LQIAITAIRGILEILRESAEKAEELIPVAIRQSDYIFRLIRDAGELEKALEELKPVNVVEIVKDVVEQFKNVEVDLTEEVIVEANEGGEIKVEDNRPSGAIFEIRIPKIKGEG